MGRDHPKQRFNPRSPVQPERSRAKYFVAAAVAAGALIWSFREWASSERARRQQEPAASAEQLPVSKPEPGDVRTVFSADDYPAVAQRNGEEGTVRARLDVDESGRVTRCSIVQSSGHASLDTATCNILKRRARFAPAYDRDGNRVSAEYFTPRIIWRLEG